MSDKQLIERLKARVAVMIRERWPTLTIETADLDRLLAMAEQVCVGDHVAETLADEAAAKIDALHARLAAVEGELQCANDACRIEAAAVADARRHASELQSALTARDDEVRRLRDALERASKTINSTLVPAFESLSSAERTLCDAAVIVRDALVLASPPPPRTITGDGQLLPPGVWVTRDALGPYAILSSGDYDTLPGWTYTYVGPQPAEQETDK